MAFTFLYELRRSDTNALLADGEVVLFSDLAMTTAVDSQRTDAFGVATFLGTVTGTYYSRRLKSGFSGSNPQTIALVEGVTETASGTLTPIVVDDAATVADVEEEIRRLLRDDQGGQRWDPDVLYELLNLAGRHLRKMRRDLFLSSGGVDQPWTDVTASTDVLPVTKDYVEPLAHWVLYLAMSELDPETMNVASATGHARAFYELLGIKAS